MAAKIDNVKKAATAVRATFSERRDPMLPGELSDAQRELLVQVCPLNVTEEGLFYALNARGLPADRPSLERFCGVAKPGPLDAEVSGVPLWKHLRDAMDNDGDFSILGTLGDKKVLAACEDALTLYRTLHLLFPRRTPDAFRTAAGYGALAAKCSEQLVAHVPRPLIDKGLHALARSTARAPNWLSLTLMHSSVSLGGKPEAFAKLVVPAIKPGAEPLMRKVLEAFDARERAKLILSKQPAFVWSGSGYVFHGCVPYLDLVGTTEAASILVDALTTRNDPPIDMMTDVLIAIGKPAIEVIDSALEGDHEEEIRAALRRARRTLTS